MLLVMASKVMRFPTMASSVQITISYLFSLPLLTMPHPVTNAEYILQDITAYHYSLQLVNTLFVVSYTHSWYFASVQCKGMLVNLHLAIKYPDRKLTAISVGFPGVAD